MPYPPAPSPLPSYLSDLGLTPYIKYSPYSSKPIFEFDTVFNANTGNLNIKNTGVGIKLNKNSSFTFKIYDRELNYLSSTSDFVQNAHINGINIDILNSNGSLVYKNYISNTLRNTIDISETDNSILFGSYNENFGIGINISGQNGKIHSNEFYVFSNSLEIESLKVRDQYGYWLNEDPIDWQNYNPYIETGSDTYAFKNNTYDMFYMKDHYIKLNAFNLIFTGSLAFAYGNPSTHLIDWGDGSTGTVSSIILTSGATSSSDPVLSGYVAGGYTYRLSGNHTYVNTGDYIVNFLYSGVSSTGYSIYNSYQYSMPYQLKSKGFKQFGDPSTGKINFDITFQNDPSYTRSEKIELYASQSSGVLNIQDNLIKTIPIFSNAKNYSFFLDRSQIESNKDYWFRLKSYSTISNGYDWVVGPYSIELPAEEKTVISANEFQLLKGDAKVSLDIVTGVITTNSETVIDSLIKGSGYSYEYLSQFQDNSGIYCSSKLMIVDNTSGLDLLRTGLSFSEYAISDNSFVNYSISEDSTNIYLKAQLDTPDGIYKLYKTSI
jgi:hypothetical protein